MRSKRVLAMLLTLTMIVSGVPSAAIAAETEAPVQAEEQQYNDVEAQDSVEDGEAAEITEVPAESQEEAAAPAEAVSEEETPAAAEAPETEEASAQTEEAPAQAEEAEVMTFEGRANGVNVYVEAPAGAFAEGTVMTVKKASAQDVIDAINDTEDVNIEVKSVKAVDITFTDASGDVQPKLPINVKLTSDLVAETEAPIVVHVDDEGVAEEMTEVQAVEGEDDAIEFEAEHFSVYAIVETDTPGESTPYRTTYEFYEADGTRFYFKDAAGKNQTSQILKNGEVLEDVGIPKSASQNAKFIGWYDEDGNKVEVNEAKTVTATKTVKLTARMQGIINVFFVTAVMKDDQGQDMSRSVVTVKQVEYEVGQSTPITVDTSDVTTEAPTSEQAVVGWNRSGTAADAGTVEGTNGVITLYENGNADPINDVMLFPAIQSAYWLYFNENDGGTGGGASYTAPQFVMIGGKPVKPADPHRTGYEFGGWYKDAECTQQFNFNQVMTSTTTVYAKWTGSDTTYSIVVWVQRTSDSANLPNNGQNVAEANRTYDFYKAYSVTSSTGATATVANSPYKQLGSTLDAHGHIKYNRCDADKTVEANGSTVLNVYYDRDVMTIRWRNSQNGSDTDVWRGLYDATFAEANKTWKSGSWRSPRYQISVMDAFVDFDTEAATELILYPNSESGNYHLYFYKENFSGGYDQVYSSAMGGNTNVTLAEKYKPGFYLDSYVRNGGTTYPSNANWSKATAGNAVNNNYSNVHVRYARKAFDIEYHNGTKGTEGTIVRTDSVKYEMPLTDHTNPTVTYPVASDADHYNFVGWFADSSWSTMVTFTELTDQEKANYRNWYGVSTFVVVEKMPSHNFPLYAGYALKGWDCAINPNGGTLTNSGQAGVFWLNYGETFSSDLKTNITREGYIFQGWMTATVPLKDDGTLNLLNVTTDAANHRFVGDYSNWTMTETPWEFSTGISGPTALMAKWFFKTSMSVQYDANGGSGEPEDNGAYSDHATTVAFRAPDTTPNNANFLGWDIVGTTAVEHLRPGDSFEVSSDYADGGVVTLKAVYSTTPGSPEVPVTHITWYDNFTVNPEVGTNFITDDGLKINEEVPIEPADKFSRKGYKFIGWARVATTNAQGEPLDGYTLAPRELTKDDLFLKYVEAAEGVEAHFETTDKKTVTKVAADENYPYHDMYAVWERQKFYIYHSADQSVDTIYMDEINDNGTFDITSKVKSGTYYGGYYSDYAKKGSYKGDGIAVNDGTPYSGGSGSWAGKNAYTVPGTAMKPAADHTYYLKEVPVGYIRPYMEVVYNTYKSNKIENIYLMTAVDDKNYTDLGIDVTVISTVTMLKKYVGNFSFTNSDGSIDKITPKTAFSGYGITKGFLGVWDAPDALEKLADNADFTYTPYWITPDNIKVTGKTRTVNVGNKKYVDNFAAPGLTFVTAE